MPLPVVEGDGEVVGIGEAIEVIFDVRVISVLLPLGRVLVVVIFETVVPTGPGAAMEVELEPVAGDDEPGEVDFSTEVLALPEVFDVVTLEGPVG